MKKLLTILGVISLTVSASATVVSCSLTDGISESIDKKVNDLSKVVTAALRPAIAHTIANRDTGALWSGLSGTSANDAISGLDINDERSVKDIIVNPLQFKNTEDIAHLSDVDTKDTEVLKNNAMLVAPSTINTISTIGGMALNLFASQGGFQPNLAHSISPILSMVNDVLGYGSNPIIETGLKIPIIGGDKLYIKHIFIGLLGSVLNSIWEPSNIDNGSSISISLSSLQQALGLTGIVGGGTWSLAIAALPALIGPNGVIGKMLPKWIKLSSSGSTLKISFDFQIPKMKDIVSGLKNGSINIDGFVESLVNDDYITKLNESLVENLDFSKDDYFNGHSLKGSAVKKATNNKHLNNAVINLIELIFKPTDNEISIHSLNSKGKLESVNTNNLLVACLSFILLKTEKATIKVDKVDKELELATLLGLSYDEDENPMFYGYGSTSSENKNQHGTLFNTLYLIFESDLLKLLMSQNGLQIFKTLNEKMDENRKEFFTPLIDERNFKINKISHSGFDKQDEDSILEFDITFTNPIFDKIINLHNETDNGLVFKQGKFHVVVTGSDGEPYKIESLELISKT